MALKPSTEWDAGRPKPRFVPAMERIIECEKLWKWYPTPRGKLEVLKGLDLFVEMGDFVAIVGASGVGKSTLLHILGLLDAPSDGRAFVCGHDASKLSGAQAAQLRAKMIGFVFQFHHLLPEFTALENLIIPVLIGGGDVSSGRKRALELLESLGVAQRKDHFPAQLSGGEQQRVALARALMNEPKILIADEPTGNLDEENTHKFMGLVASIRRELGVTVLLATHNLAVAKYAEKVYLLRDGRLHRVDGDVAL